MGELRELEECYLKLEQQRFQWPAQKFAECATELESKIRIAEARLELRNNQVEESRNDLIERGRASEADQRRNNANTPAFQNHWIVEREEVLVTDETIEKGGWGEVKVAEFRGTKVCAKYPHQAIWSEHHYELFMEEMSLASRVHHPNIVLFMGACVGKEVIMLTEIMSTSLRKQFQWKGNHLSQDQRISIGLDVTRALNYLHLMRPAPIIHRDINGANILLEPSSLTTGWRAKIADHCSINFKQQYKPTSSEIYVTPETGCSPSLSPKMDIFSFGILLVEMYTAKIPEASSYERLIASIQDHHWVKLIQDCICKNRESRPSAAEIITMLNHRHILMNKSVQLLKAESPWICPQKRVNQITDDETLLRAFQGILNKITPQNFQVLAEKALWLDINTEKRLIDCTEKILQIAMEQSKFSIVYANLSKVMSPIKVDSETEDETVKRTSFYRLLLSRVQQEFERHGNDENIVSINYAISQANSPENRNKLEKRLSEEKAQGRMNYLGNVQFIAELFKLRMVSDTIVHECIRRLLRSTFDETSLECVTILFTVAGKYLDKQKAKSHINAYMKKLSDLIKDGNVSTNIKFKLLDIVEMRENNWIPVNRRVPLITTLDQIRAEASVEEEREKLKLQQHEITRR